MARANAVRDGGRSGRLPRRNGGRYARSVPRTEVSSADLRTLIALAGELGELSTVSLSEARRHLLARIPSLVGESAIWWSVSAANQDAELAVVAGDVQGVDEAVVQRWQAEWVAAHSYRDHPMWPALYEPRTAVTLRREEVVSDRDWAVNPHIVEWGHALDLDDTLGSVAPVGADAFASLVIVRPLGERRYTARDSKLIALLQTNIAWMNRAAYDEVTRSPLEMLRAGLRPRYARVLDELLAGRSEKEIATTLSLSARTVHKYVEHLYRVFEVNSRAELMALFIHPRESA